MAEEAPRCIPAFLYIALLIRLLISFIIQWNSVDAISINDVLKHLIIDNYKAIRDGEHVFYSS